ncbi:MAG: M18 family aminopeptidase [Clostridiaceae bacterium]|nr:M18 family aminopeptidase [Clostridiaceae bacterium]
METSALNQAQELLSFIDESPTAYQAAAVLQQKLADQGYLPYDGREPLQPDDRRYCLVNGSALYAFHIGSDPVKQGFRMIGAHTDAPALKVKPNSIIQNEGCIKLNTEVYGGPILNTWFDRPLSLAGRVVLKSGDLLQPDIRLIDFRRPILVLPNLAIHMNCTVNDGSKIEAQKMLLPILALAADGTPAPADYFDRLVAEVLDMDPEALADFDLFLYDTTPGCIAGWNNEWICSARLDNLGLAYAAVQALLTCEPHGGINLAACFDNEEIGSRTKQGADTSYLRDLLEQIIYSLGGSRSDFLAAFTPSFMISADQAHAVHPNFSELSDATSRPMINRGPVIKSAAGGSYTSDADSAAVFQLLCQKAGVPWQSFVNRSDMRGGSTIGPVFSGHLPIRSVDVGNPIWGMHSIRETGGVMDHVSMLAVMRTFFSLN